MTWKQLQDEQREWSLRNFGPHTAEDPEWGMFEELGELCHAHLKAKQGIRGTAEEHQAKKVDAVADVMIYLADYCTCRGWDLENEYQTAIGTVEFGTGLPAIVIIRKAFGCTENPRGLIRWLLRYCHLHGIDLEAATFDTWANVKQRDWTADPKGGEAAV